VHPSFYDPERLGLSRVGIDYLLPIFNNALGVDDLEHVRQSMFRRSNLSEPYHSVNVDVNKRICYLD
jgi:6-phosphofructokinase 1